MRTAKELMTTSVPKAQPDETVGVALERLREQKPEEASHLYLIDEASVLTSQVPIERLIAAAPERRLGDVESMVVVGKPFAEILRIAFDLHFSLIVMGIRGRHQGGIEEILFGSTAEKVLRAARIPVVCVPPGTVAETNGGRWQ